MCDRPTEEFAISIVANFVAPSRVDVCCPAAASSSTCGDEAEDDDADDDESVFMFKRYFINKSHLNPQSV